MRAYLGAWWYGRRLDSANDRIFCRDIAGGARGLRPRPSGKSESARKQAYWREIQIFDRFFSFFSYFLSHPDGLAFYMQCNVVWSGRAHAI